MTNKQILLSCLMVVAFAIEVKAQNKIVYVYDDAGNRTERRIMLTKSAGAPMPKYFKEILDEQIIKIYPNPTDGEFAVEILNVSPKVTGTYSIYNMKSELLQQKEFVPDEKTFFDLRTQSEGIYLLKIQLGDELSTWKIIKK